MFKFFSDFQFAVLDGSPPRCRAAKHAGRAPPARDNPSQTAAKHGQLEAYELVGQAMTLKRHSSMALACSRWRLRATSNKQPVGNTPAETETTSGERKCIHLVALWQKGQHFLERSTLFEKGSIFAKG